ncbi:MAG: ComF family protein [Bacteroidetes bacterium]|nr:MAG: ComF family protein [Bacteroidota bacterium]
MKKVLQDFVDLVFPNCCPGCDQPLVSGEKYICTSCDLDLPLFDAKEDILSYFAGRLELSEARAYLKFYSAGIAQKLLHHIKYKGDQDLGEFLGTMFINHLNRDGVFSNIDVIIPVPLHKSKLRSRGYNQSEVLAKGMAEVLHITVDSTSVIRVRKSETQTRKDRAQRWQNVSGIFNVEGKALEGKNVLLVDDVITTGATLEACGEVILAAGAGSLSIAALAAAM